MRCQNIRFHKRETAVLGHVLAFLPAEAVLDIKTWKICGVITCVFTNVKRPFGHFMADLPAEVVLFKTRPKQKVSS